MQVKGTEDVTSLYVCKDMPTMGVICLSPPCEGGGEMELEEGAPHHVLSGVLSLQTGGLWHHGHGLPESGLSPRQQPELDTPVPVQQRPGERRCESAVSIHEASPL